MSRSRTSAEQKVSHAAVSEMHNEVGELWENFAEKKRQVEHECDVYVSVRVCVLSFLSFFLSLNTVHKISASALFKVSYNFI